MMNSFIKPNNIAFFGNLGTGKSTQANLLNKKYPDYIQLSFAEAVREQAIEVLSTITTLDPKLIEVFFKEPHYSIFKNTKLSLNNITLDDGTRGLLKGIGESGRIFHGEDCWVNALIKKREEMKIPKSFLYTDVRYANEVKALKPDTIIVYLDKPDSDQDHASERTNYLVKSGKVIPDVVIPYYMGIDITHNIVKKLVYDLEYRLDKQSEPSVSREEILQSMRELTGDSYEKYNDSLKGIEYNELKDIYTKYCCNADNFSIAHRVISYIVKNYNMAESLAYFEAFENLVEENKL